MQTETTPLEPDAGEDPEALATGYDFGGATFDLDDPGDREILRFILSQALFGEATGVYCGRSLYAARSLEAARFYVRQARQELGHLQLFADIFRDLGLEPMPPHWVIRLLSAHNNYYPLKVLLEHAVGEGMVLDVFKDLLLQTLPESDPRVPPIKKKLRVVAREEAEHVAWGEKETLAMLRDKPWLRAPYFGLVELQLLTLPALVSRVAGGRPDHPVLSQLVPFVEHVRARVREQGRRLGFYPEQAPGWARRSLAMAAGTLLFARSQLSRSESKLDKNYLSELGF
ncbi:MAG TPA: ferritin-like domain-containing protein [Polyangiaceae bacterium]|nr:ferritin-like domain-containing protein [Polyangiaceae bacterium]